MPKRIVERIKHHLHEVLKIKRSPHSIAIGFAIGTFIAIMPTPGLNIILGLLVVLVYRNVSKIALFGAMILWNPVVLAPLYVLSFKIGNFIFGGLPLVEYKFSMWDRIYNFSRRFLVGNLILAASISTISYFIVRKLANYHQIKKILEESQH